MFNVDDIRSEFPILSRQVNGKSLIYLDSAATSQKPSSVIDRISYLYRLSNSNIHRGIHTLAEECTFEYENARSLVSKFINAYSTREVVFTSGATASINLVAYSYSQLCFTQGDNMVVSEMEHHSNIVPWQLMCERYGVELRVLPFSDDGALCLDQLSGLLDERTRMVAVTQTSNVLGTNNDIKTLSSIVRSHCGAKILVDGCQGIVHNSVDVQDLDVDFYAFSGHKLYAPTGIGVLWAREALLDAMPPFMGGGDMISTVSLTRGTTWAELPLKFEAGTTNFIGAIALGEALNFCQRIDRKGGEAHQRALLDLFSDSLRSEIDGVTIYGTTAHKAPVCSFNIEGVHPMDVAQIVDKLGVALRSGTHCAEPVMHHFGVHSMSRASFAIFNTTDEVLSAVAAIKRATSMLR